MANLFDIAMIFAVALMVAMTTYFQVSELLTQDNMTMVKNPGKENMEIIIKKGKEITRYKAGKGAGEGQTGRVAEYVRHFYPPGNCSDFYSGCGHGDKKDGREKTMNK
jgi:hypothetical protein